MALIADVDVTSLAAWCEVVRVLPTPAALIDAQGKIITASRWVEHNNDGPLVDMSSATHGIANGAVGKSRWRVRPIRKGEATYLATIERLGTADHILRRFFAGTDKLFVIYDQAGKALEWNTAWQRILGFSNEDMLGRDSWALLPTEDREMRSVVEQELRTRGRSEPSWRMQGKDGTYHLIHWVLLFDPTVGRCFGVGHVAAPEEQRRTNGDTPTNVPSEAASLADRQHELHRRAYTDDLTGLASRTRTVAELNRHLRNDGSPAVLFCDLDQFKVVNDSLGHAAGDRLLEALGERLTSALDSDDIMVGRLGGDEFAVVIAKGGLAAAEAAANRAFTAISSDFSVAGRSVRVGMSIGICAAAPGEQLTAEMMFERADMAVYQAKEDGRNRSVVYGERLQQQVDRRFELETAMREGLDRGEFEPWFQPVVNVADVQIVGVEALLRWKRQDGLTAPNSFLDVAMESGLIKPIGRQMIEKALNQFGSMGRLTERIWLTLNVSARELADEAFTEWFVDRVGASGLRPSQIVIEITESVAIEEHSLSDQLTVFRALGFRIALDDFGTGHSSLAHLRTLPIDMVKIDRSFVHDLVDDQTTRALTRSIVDLCAALGLAVIFEGVESNAEAQAVVRAGGTYAQGYLYSPALPASELQWRTVGAALSARLASLNRGGSAPQPSPPDFG